MKESTITPKMISRPIAETCQMASCQAPLGRRGVRPAAAGRAGPPLRVPAGRCMTWTRCPPPRVKITLSYRQKLEKQQEVQRTRKYHA